MKKLLFVIMMSTFLISPIIASARELNKIYDSSELKVIGDFADTYVVTIPDSFILIPNEDVTKKISLSVTRLSDNEVLEVSVISNNGLMLIDNETNSKISYNLYIDNNEANNGENIIFSTIPWNGEDIKLESELVFHISDRLIYSGNYYDTLTFNVSKH